MKISTNTKILLVILVSCAGLYWISRFTPSQNPNVQINTNTIDSNLKDNITAPPDWVGTTVRTDATELIEAELEPNIRLWKSYNDRTLVGEVKDDVNLSLIGYDSKNHYCYVKYKATSGWLSCDWLIGLPNTLNDYQ